MSFEGTSPTSPEQTSRPESIAAETISPPVGIPQPHHQPLTPDQVRRQLDGIRGVLGSTNISPESQREITETVEAENTALRSTSELPATVVTEEQAPNEEPSSNSETTIEKNKELASLYRRRLIDLADSLTPAAGRLQALSRDLNPRDITCQPLQRYLDENLPHLASLMRGLEEITNQIKPEKLINPQNQEQFLVVLSDYKSNLLNFSQRFVQDLQILRQRTQKFLEEQRREFDPNHPINQTLRASLISPKPQPNYRLKPLRPSSFIVLSRRYCMIASYEKRAPHYHP